MSRVSLPRLTPWRLRVMAGGLIKEGAALFGLPAAGAVLGAMGYAGISWWLIAKAAAFFALVCAVALMLLSIFSERPFGSGLGNAATTGLVAGAAAFLGALAFLSIPYALGAMLALELG